ncbi:AI-2E family transporter [Candidatus Saccharibacteria bacterium]|nr:AI-2E family transporter [Candidatus Saccharibacteria bacterium]
MNSKYPNEVTVSNRTVVRIILLTIATFLAIRFTSNVANVLVLIFVAFFLALALNPAVGWIARKLQLKSRAAATGIAYLLVLIVLGAFLAYVVPPLVRQTVDFVADAPQTIDNLENDGGVVSDFIQRYNLSEQLDGFTANLQERTKDLQKPIVASAGRVGSAMLSILTVLVLTFMMLVEGPVWIARYWKLQPSKRREHHKQLAAKMYRVVTGFVNGQLLLALIAASFAFIVLLIASTLLEVSVNAVALAGILIFTGLIPMIGNTIGGIIVTLACLFVSAPLALIMAVFFVLYQQIENISLQPYIQAKYNELSPLLVFVAALLGIGFGGLLGGLIAIPAAGCAKILLEDYLERREAN